jgi:hypothetical protein
MRFHRLAALAAAALLAACETNSYCMRPQPYAKAPSVAPIAAVNGLQIPDSPIALKVPPPTANETPFGGRMDDPQSPGRKKIVCLTDPPPMPANAQAGAVVAP